MGSIADIDISPNMIIENNDQIVADGPVKECKCDLRDAVSDAVLSQNNMARSHKAKCRQAGTNFEPNGNTKEKTALVIRDLTTFVIKYVAVDADVRPSSSYAATMKRTVDEILYKYTIVFNSMAKKLDLAPDQLEDTFVKTIEEMCQDSNINWGRIVTVYAFIGVIAKHYIQSGMIDMLNVLVTTANKCLLHRFGVWIDKEGGWDAFNARFPPPNHVENSIWKGLFFTAVGLGALATMAAAR